MVARLRARLRRVRGRLRDLRHAYVKRHARSVYWNGRVALARADRDPRLPQIRAKRDQSRLLGSHLKRAEKKQRKLRKALRSKLNQIVDTNGDGLITVDGKPVSAEVGREVLRIREGDRWKGVIVSGYRTPEYSEHLCYLMCGRPRCPGRCAGRSSNHTLKGGRNGAVDVSDYLTFAAECRRLNSWLTNNLPSDLVHFSDSGF